MSQHESRSITSSPSPILSSTVETLTAAFASETKLIDDLTAVVLRQRDAIANDDIQTVDDTVFTTHRLLLTLEEARTRRRTLYRLLGYNEDISMLTLEEALGDRMTPALRKEREILQTAAERLSNEIRINREILQMTLEQGDSYIRAMTGATTSRSPVYSIDGMTAPTTVETSFTRTA